MMLVRGYARTSISNANDGVRAPLKQAMRWQMNFVLAAGPMRPWFYGFGKEMASLRERYRELSLEIVVGGLAPV
jgi:hypothetical protein